MSVHYEISQNVSGRTYVFNGFDDGQPTWGLHHGRGMFYSTPGNARRALKRLVSVAGARGDFFIVINDNDSIEAIETWAIRGD